jgi:hypothetical protein
MTQIKIILCLLVFNLSASVSNGQSDTIGCLDIIKLKNGFVMKCKITDVSELGIQVNKTTGESLFFPHHDITILSQCDKTLILKNKPIYFDEGRIVLWQLSLGASLSSKDRNYGLLDGRSLEGNVKIRVSPRNGGHFIKSNISKIKLETVQSFSMWHVGAGYEYVLSRKKISPFVFGNVGFGFGLRLDEREAFSGQAKVTSKGGKNHEVGIGLLIRSTNGYAFTLSSSVFYQPAKIDITYTNWVGSNKYDLDLRRTFLKLGFVF